MRRGGNKSGPLRSCPCAKYLVVLNHAASLSSTTSTFTNPATKESIMRAQA